MTAVLRVLVSSTFHDLVEDRSVVRQVIDGLSADGRPVRSVGMEEFGSYSASPQLVSRDFARVADIIVLLIGSRYGTMSELGHRSFTAEEYAVMRRERIPCLAYLKDVDPVSSDARTFRAQVSADMVPGTYHDVAELRRKLGEDLVRELDAQYAAEAGALITSAPPSGSGTFVGRVAELAGFRNALDQGVARIGVWGRSGIGKTRLVQQALAEDRLDVIAPVWIRVNDVFGRHATGERVPHGRRMHLHDVVEQLNQIASETPRAPLVFDNVQAAPSEVAQIAAGLGHARAIFLSWDLAALPDVEAVVQLNRLVRDDSRALLRSYLGPMQLLDHDGVEELLNLVDDEPLMLTLAGQRLRLPGATPRELAHELEGRLSSLEGPALDKPNVIVQDLIQGSVLSLEPRHRQALFVVAAGPAAGVSRETYSWAYRTVAPDLPPDPRRAQELDLVQESHQPDWRGRRFRLRSVVRDVLREGTGFAAASALFEDYLHSADAFSDTSIDVLELAFARQLADELWDTWDDEVVFSLLTTSRQAQRRTLCDQIRHSVHHLGSQERIAGILEQIDRADPPPPDDVVIDLIAVLPALGQAGRALLERYWRRSALTGDSEPSSPGSVSGHTIAAVARALAATEGVSLGDFLSRKIRSASQADRRLGMSAAHAAEEIGAVGALAEHLGSSRRIDRLLSLRYLGFATPDAELRDQVHTVAISDEDEQVRIEAAGLLGVWGDARARPLLLALLDHPDTEIVATVISALPFVADDAVADRMAAMRNHPDLEVRINATVVLEFCGSQHMIASAVALIDSPERRARAAGTLLITSVHPDDIPVEILHRPEVDAEIRLMMLAGRLKLGDMDAMRELLAMVHARHQIPDDLRHATVKCLGELTYTLAEHVPEASVAALLDHDDAWVRGAAASLAGQQRRTVFVAQLRSLEVDESITMLGTTVGHAASLALDRIAGRREPMVAFEAVRLRTSGINGAAPRTQGYI